MSAGSNKNQLYTIIGVIVVLGLVLFFMNRNNTESPSTDTKTPVTQNPASTPPATQTPSTPPSGGTGSIEKSGENLTITGTVAKSDNLSRGSYMVQTGSSNIYLAGTRNYSQYEGKQVQVNAKGTIEGFSIVSVEVLE